MHRAREPIDPAAVQLADHDISARVPTWLPAHPTVSEKVQLANLSYGGRPAAGQSWGAIIRERATRKVTVVEAMYDRAEQGNVAAAEWLRDTDEGKPVQRVVQMDEDGPYAKLVRDSLAELMRLRAATVDGEVRELSEG